VVDGRSLEVSKTATYGEIEEHPSLSRMQRFHSTLWIILWLLRW
jgi:hypothetical protein